MRFPESIISGFGFPQPTFMQFTDSKIQFLEINQSDSKCISVCWNQRKPACLSKTISGTQIISNINDITISKPNSIYQQFIHSDTKFRLLWEKSGVIKVFGQEGNKIIYDTRNKINKISSGIEKIMKSQMTFIYSNYILLLI